MNDTRLGPGRAILVLGTFVLGTFGPVSARAQAVTGTGGGPTSTVTAPNTSSTGRTMPRPGGDAGLATADEDRRARTPQRQEDDKLTKGICIGCGPK